MKKKAPLLLLSLLAMSSCDNGGFSSSTTYYQHRFSYTYFDTVVTVVYFDAENRDFSSEINSLLLDVHEVAEPYYAPRPGLVSAYTINSTNEPLEVNDTLLSLLNASLEAQRKTDGYFNPLIGDLSLLWKESLFGGVGAVGQTFVPSLPEEAAVEQAFADLQSSSIQIEGHTVTRIGDAKLDFGGIAKGFAMQKVEGFLKQQGVERFLVQGSISSLVYGLNSKGGEWHVELNNVEEENPFTFEAKNTSSSVSSMYEQFVYLDNQVYSHVINPKTGKAQSPFSLALVIDEDGAYMDALSTAAMNAPLETVKAWEEEQGFQVALFHNEYKNKKNVAILDYASPSLLNK